MPPGSKCKPRVDNRQRATAVLGRIGLVPVMVLAGCLASAAVDTTGHPPPPEPEVDPPPEPEDDSNARAGLSGRVFDEDGRGVPGLPE